jgi:hypothetical protein
MTLSAIIVTLIVVLLNAWAVNALLNAFSIQDPIRTVIWVMCVVLLVVYLARALGFNLGV